MKKILTAVAIIILSFSSCYEDAKPTVTISLTNIETSSDRSITITEPDIETVYIAIYKTAYLFTPVSVAAVSKGTTSVTFVVPIGEIRVGVWASDGGSSPVSYGSSISYDITEGNNLNIPISLGWFGESYWTSSSLIYSDADQRITWSEILGTTEYIVEVQPLGSGSFSYYASVQGLYCDVSGYGNGTIFRVRANSSIFGFTTEWISRTIVIP